MLRTDTESIQKILIPLDEDTAFNAMIWAEALRGTGNNNYQNKFYDRQADKIRSRYERLFG